MDALARSIEETVQRLKKLIRRAEVKRYAILYLTLALIALVLAVILVVKPKLQRGDGWLGVNVHADAVRGALVIEEVIAESPAYDVGMLNGDVILSYKGLAVSDVNTLKTLVHDSYVNELVRIILERNRVRLVADTRIAERPHHVDIAPPILTIIQGASAPHAERGLCVRCHTIVPRSPS